MKAHGSNYVPPVFTTTPETLYFDGASDQIRAIGYTKAVYDAQDRFYKNTFIVDENELIHPEIHGKDTVADYIR